MDSAGNPESSYISVTYWDTTTTPFTQCGHYDATTSSFVSDNGYTEANCLVQGAQVRIEVAYVYHPVTPALGGWSFQIVEGANAILEQNG